MTILKSAYLIICGLGSGFVISGAVFAFIAVIGIVPRMAQKTKTKKYIKLYETAIMIGGIFGATTMFIQYHIPIGTIPVVIISFCIGIFIGSLAVSLAEVLEVTPILARRLKLHQGMTYFITAIALGKLLGSVLYYTLPGFLKK